MLAIGAGGLDVALAMSGEPFPTMMPAILGVRLKGELPDWVSAKDVILEMLRRRGVSGGVGKIIEYFGAGLRCLGAMDRHVIANMGAELGATTTVFPSDEETLHFLQSQGRDADWRAVAPDAGCSYDEEDEIDLSELEPLVATPSSPGNVVKVGEIAGKDVYQTYIGSSANPGWRDFAVAAEIVRGKTVPVNVSFDVNPTSRELLETLIADGRLGALVAAGARIHQTGCNGCIGMGQRSKLAAHHAAQFSRPLGHGRGFGLSLLARDGGRLGAGRPHYRSTVTRYRVSKAGRASACNKQRGVAGGAATGGEGSVSRARQRSEHSLVAGVRSASRQSRVASTFENG